MAWQATTSWGPEQSKLHELLPEWNPGLGKTAAMPVLGYPRRLQLTLPLLDGQMPSETTHTGGLLQPTGIAQHVLSHKKTPKRICWYVCTPLLVHTVVQIHAAGRHTLQKYTLQPGKNSMLLGWNPIINNRG